MILLNVKLDISECERIAFKVSGFIGLVFFSHGTAKTRLAIWSFSSRSRGRVRGGGEKHEIYMAAFGGHLFYDLFSQGREGGMPPSAPLDPILSFLYCLEFICDNP